MPSIADQVETLEHDHAAALAKIDALTASNAALTSANTALQAENVTLQASVEDMKQYVADTRAMADSLAQSALEMLRASRRHVGPAHDMAPFDWSPGQNVATKQSAVVVQSDSGDETSTRTTILLANQFPAPPPRLRGTDTLVERNDGFRGDDSIVGDLPIFLQRDTPFERANVLS